MPPLAGEEGQGFPNEGLDRLGVDPAPQMRDGSVSLVGPVAQAGERS